MRTFLQWWTERLRRANEASESIHIDAAKLANEAYEAGRDDGYALGHQSGLATAQDVLRREIELDQQDRCAQCGNIIKDPEYNLHRGHQFVLGGHRLEPRQVPDLVSIRGTLARIVDWQGHRWSGNEKKLAELLLDALTNLDRET